jgi:hypothetical protein
VSEVRRKSVRGSTFSSTEDGDDEEDGTGVEMSEGPGGSAGDEGGEDEVDDDERGGGSAKEVSCDALAGGDGRSRPARCQQRLFLDVTGRHFAIRRNPFSLRSRGMAAALKGWCLLP